MAKRGGGKEKKGIRTQPTCALVSLDTQAYHVIDEKRTTCSGNNYFYEGRYNTNNWHIYSQKYLCGSGSACDPNYDGDVCTTETCTPANPCRRLEGQSCDETNGVVTDDCYSGLVCSTNTCVSFGNTTTDLIITKIVPIQVVPNADMVMGKRTLVRVYLLNNGSFEINARVNISTSLSTDVPISLLPIELSIEPYEIAYVDFTLFEFTEPGSGTITAQVEIV